MIQINHLSKKYGSKIILEQVCCQLENHRIYGLAGVNGAGKSTLLQAIAQPEVIDSGNVKVDGIDSRVFESRYHFFYIPDNKEMFLNLSGKEYLKFVVKIYHQDKKKADERLRKLSSAFGMEPSLDECIGRYSFGMKQKVYLMAAFLSGAGNFILDEPFNGLDFKSADALKQMLLEYRNAGNLILLSIHNPDFISGLCDSVIFMDKQNVTVYSSFSLT